MAVRFIPGRSGSGKTSVCLKAIADSLLDTDDERGLILLVPEQATYQCERALLGDKRIGGYSRLRGFFFVRLRFFLADQRRGISAVS